MDAAFAGSAFFTKARSSDNASNAASMKRIFATDWKTDWRAGMSLYPARAKTEITGRTLWKSPRVPRRYRIPSSRAPKRMPCMANDGSCEMRVAEICVSANRCDGTLKRLTNWRSSPPTLTSLTPPRASWRTL